MSEKGLEEVIDILSKEKIGHETELFELDKEMNKLHSDIQVYQMQIAEYEKVLRVLASLAWADGFRSAKNGTPAMSTEQLVEKAKGVFIK